MDLRQHTYCLELELVPTDIMSMINVAWECSFGDVDRNQDAIATILDGIQ